MAQPPKLPPWLILAELRQHFGHEWRKKISGNTLLKLIGMEGEEPSQASRILIGEPSERARLQLLKSEIQEDIAEYLGLPGIFDSTDLGDFAQRLRQAGRRAVVPLTDSPADAECFFIPQTLRELDIELHDVERAEVDQLAKKVTDSTGRKVLCWSVPGNKESVGAGLLAYAVASELPGKGGGVRETFMIRPFADFTEKYIRAEDKQDSPEDSHAEVKAFEDGLRRLAEHFGLTSSRLHVDLLQCLIERKAVLFVLNAELLPEQYGSVNLMLRLLTQVTRSGLRRDGEPAPIVLVGDVPGQVRNKLGIETTSDIRADMLSAAERRQTSARNPEAGRTAKTEIRVSFFRKEWHRYCQRRGVHTDDWLGARLRMAEWFYDTIEDPWIWPSSIRMRAFLASNYGTNSFFDPTQGWTRLAGMSFRRLPIEIRLLLDDAVVHARAIHDRTHRRWRAGRLEKGDPHQPDLRALRWVSTSLYWLTEGAVADLTDKLAGRRHLFGQTVNRFGALIRLMQSTELTEKRFRSALSIKAIVQDRWLLQDAAGRRMAHYIVAQRLWLGQNNKALLDQEFPIGPSYGRVRHVIMGEALRHLMRACEGLPQRERKSAHPFPKSKDRSYFPSKPDKDGNIDVEDVVNFCFGNIFWVEINDNHPQIGHIHRRKLGRQHGLYTLALELLELMSAEGKLGEPHWALHPSHVHRYHREVALAQLDVGELDQAERNIRQVVNMTADGSDPIAHLQYKLDLVVILATRDRLAHARAVLSEVEHAFNELPKPLPSGAVASGLEATYRERYNRMPDRITGRKGHLLYLEGDYDAAKAVYATLEREDLLRREMAHPYIALLGAIGDPDSLEKARSCARAARHRSAMDRYYHERLGYEIAIAHVMRKLGRDKEAEEDLDEVYEYILSEGCSERTCQAFLLEAGRVLIAQRRFARAYTVYLRPCLDRAASRGFIRTAKTALRHARAALDAIPAEIAACDRDGEFADKLKYRVLQGDETMSKGINKYMPKYAFGKFEPGRWFPIFSEESAIREQLTQLDEIAGRIKEMEESEGVAPQAETTEDEVAAKGEAPTVVPPQPAEQTAAAI